MTKVRKQKKNLKHRALKPNLNLKTRWEEIQDLASYADTLSEEDRDWLNRFAEEYICANFRHKGETIHKNEEQIKEIYTRNNARNRCIFTREKAQGILNYLEEITDDEDVLDYVNLMRDNEDYD
jgi:uncharacterized protein YecE (DUF72 family)